MDQKVLMTQKWLNATYKNSNGYISCAEDGQTGNGTVASLISALQIEIGVSTPTGEFGPMTAELCPTVQSGVTGHIVNIIQGGLWCKGFSSQDLNQNFDNTTVSGVNQFKMAAGLTADGKVDAKTMKGLLSTDATVLISGGDSRIRAIQQALNNKYSDYFWIDLNICPCDGIYGRNTCNALLYAFQKEVGIDEPNGAFGPGTAQGANDHNVALNSKQTTLVYLLQYMLYVNGFNPGSFDGIFDTEVENAVINFQSLMALDADGWVGLSTWAALLVSKGNVNRSPNACDCTDKITLDRALNLKANGVDYVGRYLTGYWSVSRTELNNMRIAGLKYIPIFERSGKDILNCDYDVTEARYFNYAQGRADAAYAVEVAENLGLPDGAVIYFAVDFDVYDFEVTSNVIPYFRGVKASIGSYKVGIYGPRYACTAVSNAGYTEKSYVADMSTGFSGNIGQRIPENWAFDQYYETSIGSGYSAMDIDKVIASGRDAGVSNYDSSDLARKLAESMLVSFNLRPIGWEWNNTYTTFTTYFNVFYKMGIEGNFDPIVNLANIPASQKSVIKIENGVFDKLELNHAQEIYKGFTSDTKLAFGNDGFLSPSVELANTVGKGSVTVSFEVQGGLPSFAILVEQTVHESSTDTEKVYFEIKMTANPATGAMPEMATVKEYGYAVLTAIGLLLFVPLVGPGIITAVPTVLGTLAEMFTKVLAFPAI